MHELDRPLDPDRDRWFLGTLDSIVARSAETNGVYSIVLRIAPRGFAPPRHQHTREDTGFLVLDGRLKIEIGGVEELLGPNEFRFAPRGVPHGFVVETETARFLEILSPGGFEGFHLALSHPAPRFEIPPADHPKPSKEEMSRASREFGSIIEP